MRLDPSKTLVRRVLKRGAGTVVSLGPLALGRCGCAIVSAKTDTPIAALTFDDGPNPECTPEVLSTLERHKARATFFMIGELAVREPALVREVARAGHAIGNHSWNHPSMPLLNPRQCLEQLRACHKALAPYASRWFRPPYGHQSLSSWWRVRRAGYQVVAFNVHVEDWLDRDADWMAERLVKRIRPGAIVILHDNIYRNILPRPQHDRKPMLAALSRALAELQGRFEFVTLPELLRRGRPVRQSWRRQADAELLPALKRHLCLPCQDFSNQKEKRSARKELLR